MRTNTRVKLLLCAHVRDDRRRTVKLIHHSSTSYQLQISVLCVDNMDLNRLGGEGDTGTATLFGESSPEYPYRSVFTS